MVTYDDTFFAGDKVRYLYENDYCEGRITEFGYTIVWDENIECWIPIVIVKVNGHLIKLSEVEHAQE